MTFPFKRSHLLINCKIFNIYIIIIIIIILIIIIIIIIIIIRNFRFRY